MSPDLSTAIITAAGAVAAVVAGYVLTKRAEREANWRKEKLERYKAFVASLGGTLEGETGLRGQEEFAQACNDINLFAPQRVLDALRRFRDEIHVSNPSKSRERHDLLLNELFYEIRKDLAVRPRDNRETFTVRIWSVGRHHFPNG